MFEQVSVAQEWSVHSFYQNFTEYTAHAIVLDSEDIKMNEKLVVIKMFIDWKGSLTCEQLIPAKIIQYFLTQVYKRGDTYMEQKCFRRVQQRVRVELAKKPT